jgi:hypothetical protein
MNLVCASMIALSLVSYTSAYWNNGTYQIDALQKRVFQLRNPTLGANCIVVMNPADDYTRLGLGDCVSNEAIFDYHVVAKATEDTPRLMSILTFQGKVVHIINLIAAVNFKYGTRYSDTLYKYDKVSGQIMSTTKLGKCLIVSYYGVLVLGKCDSQSVFDYHLIGPTSGYVVEDVPSHYYRNNTLDAACDCCAS